MMDHPVRGWFNQTTAVLRAAGFRTVEIEPFRLRTVFLPLRYQIAATCIA